MAYGRVVLRSALNFELLNPDFVHVTRVVSGTRFRDRNDRYAEVNGR